MCYTCADVSKGGCSELLRCLRAATAIATAASSIASTMLGITIIALALNNNKWHDRGKCMNKQQCKSEILNTIMQILTSYGMPLRGGEWMHMECYICGMVYGVVCVYIIHFERVLGECVSKCNKYEFGIVLRLFFF